MNPAIDATPFLKWAGGKTQLLSKLEQRLPERFNTYHEPFLGSGALFFRLARLGRIERALLTDVNRDLILTYTQVRDNVEGLIAALEEHRERHDREHFYAARDRFNGDGLDPTSRAAIFIYLNKTCFNGLYRVNRRGHYNVPMGRYESPSVVNPDRMRSASAALQGVSLRAEDFTQPYSSRPQPIRVSLRAEDFTRALAHVAPGDFVYLDPPYVPLSATANFTAYDRDGFRFEDQRRLAAEVRRLDGLGAKVMLSNHATDELIALYDGFGVEILQATRMINRQSDRRGKHTAEVLVRNYP